MTVWEFRTAGTGLCHHVTGSMRLFAQLINQSFHPAFFSGSLYPPCWESRGGKSSPLLGSPVTPWGICWTLQRAEATQDSLGNLCKCQTTQIFPDLYQPKLEGQLCTSLLTARYKSSYILSPHKKKWHAPSWSLYFKPSQPTSDLADLGSSCSNSTLQAHSSCARQEQQTFCSFSNSIFFQKQTLQRRVHCLLCWKGYILI